MKRTFFFAAGLCAVFAASFIFAGTAHAAFKTEDLSDSQYSFMRNYSGIDHDFTTCTGDVNGDGYDDIMIGNSQDYFEDVYLYYGKSEKFTGSGSPDVIFNDVIGTSLACNGDVNGDGKDDILIGVDNNAYLFFGGFLNATNIYTWDPAIPSLEFRAENGADEAGAAVLLSDINNDGYADIFVGAPGYDSDAGRVYMFYGRTTFVGSYAQLGLNNDNIWTGTTGSRTGAALASGDVNEDNKNDLLVGAPESRVTNDGDGAVYLIMGESGYPGALQSITSADTKFTGSSREKLGYAISAGGDANHDGKDDILIGAPYANANGTDSGAAYLFYGKGGTPFTSSRKASSSDVKFYGQADNDLAGGGVAITGDTNGDGKDDLFIASTTNTKGRVDDDYHGSVYQFNGGYIDDGNINLKNADVKFIHLQDDDSGTVTAYLSSGDINNDGKADVLVGTGREAKIIYGSKNFTGYRGTEIKGDKKTNDGDSEIDEDNTLSENGVHPTYGTKDPLDKTDAIKWVRGYKNGRIRVKFKDNSVYRYKIFDVSAKKITRVKQYKKKGYAVVLHPKGKKVALVNLFTGEVVDTEKFFNDSYSERKLRFITDPTNVKKKAAVVVMNNGNTFAALIQINPKKETLKMKDNVQYHGFNMHPKYTDISDRLIVFRDKYGRQLEYLKINSDFTWYGGW
ncbi:MAG: FG-GAP-like repeat-containing protein [Candidatus Kerfeldbacteria bacterium]